MAAITVEHLHVVRGGTVVLPDLSVAVAAGTVTGLLGPSGSGKSTLLRAIVGVQVVAGGRVEVLGLPAGSPSLRRRVAYTTQAPSVYTDLTLRENLAYFARVVGAPPRAAVDALETVGLADVADRPVRTFSGGQLSRASLASASPRCSCSTSPRSVSTRCCAGTCGRRSGSSPTGGGRSSSRRT